MRVIDLGDRDGLHFDTIAEVGEYATLFKEFAQLRIAPQNRGPVVIGLREGQRVGRVETAGKLPRRGGK